MHCPSCQKIIPDTARYCPFCGENVRLYADGPATFNENEDFLAGSVPRYEDSGSLFSEEDQPQQEDSSPQQEESLPREDLFREAYKKEEQADPAPVSPAREEKTGMVTSMYGEQYNAADAHYSQAVELSGLNLLTPADSGDDASNRRTAAIVLGIFAALAAVVIGVFILLISRGFGNLDFSGGSGGGLWDFLVRPRPSYAGFDESQEGLDPDHWMPGGQEDDQGGDDFWNDDFWGQEGTEDTSGSDQAFDPDQVPVQTPGLTQLSFEEYLERYQTPAELGDNLFSGNICLEGDLYRLPIPLSALIDNGWTVTELQGEKIQGDAEATVQGRGYGFITLEKGEKRLYYSTIYNPYRADRPLKDTVLLDIHCDTRDSIALDLPGLPADADAGTTKAFLEKYQFTGDTGNTGTDTDTYYLYFSTSGDDAAYYNANWITLYDYDRDGRIDSVFLNYDHPYEAN